MRSPHIPHFLVSGQRMLPLCKTPLQLLKSWPAGLQERLLLHRLRKRPKCNFSTFALVHVASATAGPDCFLINLSSGRHEENERAEKCGSSCSPQFT